MDTKPNCMAFDSLAPALSPVRASLYVARLHSVKRQFMKWRLDADALRITRLTDRRLRFGFFHHWRANRLAFFHQLKLPMLGEPSSGRN